MVTMVETVMMITSHSGCLLLDLLSVRIVRKAFIPIFGIGCALIVRGLSMNTKVRGTP